MYLTVVNPLSQVIQGHYTTLNEVILEDLTLPGLTELRGSWHGSLDASGGGNGDTMVSFQSYNCFKYQICLCLEDSVNQMMFSCALVYKLMMP